MTISQHFSGNGFIQAVTWTNDDPFLLMHICITRPQCVNLNTESSLSSLERGCHGDQEIWWFFSSCPSGNLSNWANEVVNPCAGFILGNIIGFYIYHFLISRWHRYLKSFRVEDRDTLISHSQYHGCWWSGNTRSQGINSYGSPRIFQCQHQQGKVLHQYFRHNPFSLSLWIGPKGGRH